MEKDNILVFDVETTGLPRKGQNWEHDYMKFPYIVSISWLINGVMCDFVINQEGREIPAESTKIHGITTEVANKSPHYINDVLPEFLAATMAAKKVVGHNIYFDTSITKANCLRVATTAEFVSKDLFSDAKAHCIEALHKDKRIDTMWKGHKLCGLKQKDSNKSKTPSLVELYQKLFNETFEAHKSEADARATYRCYLELVKRGLI